MLSIQRQELWASIYDAMDINSRTLELFRELCAELYQERLVATGRKGPFARKPSLGLRIQHEPGVKLVCAPLFDRAKGQFMLDKQLVELVIDTRKAVDGVSCYRPTKVVRIRQMPSDHTCRQIVRANYMENLGLMFNAMDRFIKSPGDAILGKTKCALCNRPLKDGLSISRGIGPECFDRLPTSGVWFQIIQERMGATSNVKD